MRVWESDCFSSVIFIFEIECGVCFDCYECLPSVNSDVSKLFLPSLWPIEYLLL